MEVPWPFVRLPACGVELSTRIPGVGQWEFSPSPQGYGGEARCVCGRSAARVAPAEAGVIDDLGTGSGWKQSTQNQTPLCSDETKSPSACTQLASRHSACPCSECPRPSRCVCARESRGPLAQWIRRRPPEPERPGSSSGRVNAFARRLTFPLSAASRTSPLWDSSPRPPRCWRTAKAPLRWLVAGLLSHASGLFGAAGLSQL